MALRPIRTTQLVPLVCTFDASVTLRERVEDNAAPLWILTDDSDILAVSADASRAQVRLLNDQECSEWQARLSADGADATAIVRELARLRCDRIDGPGNLAVSELPQIAQTTLGFAILRLSVYVDNPRKPICSE